MKYAVLIGASIVAGIAVGVPYVGGASAVITAVGKLAVVNAKALSAVGAVIALFQFAPRDYLRRAWSLMALGSALLVEADVVNALLEPVASATTLGLTRSVLVVASNIVAPVAMVMFARALTVAGLDMAVTPAKRVAWGAVAIVVAVAVAGPGALEGVHGLAAGNVRALAIIASALGDMVTLVLLAPLVYNVITLRGGTLLWPFVLLAASSLSWLIYDGAGIIADWIGEPTAGIPIQQCCRIWACVFLFAAGLAQRWALSGAVRASAAAGAAAGRAA